MAKDGVMKKKKSRFDITCKDNLRFYLAEWLHVLLASIGRQMTMYTIILVGVFEKIDR